MKHTLLLIAFLLSPLLSFSQQDEEEEYKAVLIYYNEAWQVTKPEAAVVKRLAYLPANINSIKNLNAPNFRYAVTDYYANNTVLARGHYNEFGEKWSKWQFYYPNGEIDCEGAFVDNKPSGVWRFWKPDGKPLMEVEYKEGDTRILNAWNPEGEQTLRDGNGIYMTEEPAADGQGVNRLEGSCIEGYQTGTWQLKNAKGRVVSHNYGSKGEFLSGEHYENGKLIKTYKAGEKSELGFVNSMAIQSKLQAVPDYMPRMELWKRDPAYYEALYPVPAELLEGKIEKVYLKSPKQGERDYYYRITQSLKAGSIDTTFFGAPRVAPVFGKGDADFKRYFSVHTKFPGELKSAGLEGLITVEFTVNEVGKVESARILKGLSPLVDEEALRVVKEMPDWKPATELGKPVPFTMIVPFRFYKGGYRVSRN